MGLKEFGKEMNKVVFAFGKCKYLGGHPKITKICEGSMAVNNDKIIFQAGFFKNLEIPISDVINCSIQTQEQISRNVTLTRLLLFGIFAFGMKKKKVDTIQYLTITYIENGIEQTVIFESNKSVQLSSAIMRARQIYSDEHKAIKPENNLNNKISSCISIQLNNLSDLQIANLIGEEEFQKKKKELLSRFTYTITLYAIKKQFLEL